MNLILSAASAGRRKLEREKKERASVLRLASIQDAKDPIKHVVLDDQTLDHGVCAQTQWIPKTAM